jgi:hypothetical protein
MCDKKMTEHASVADCCMHRNINKKVETSMEKLDIFHQIKIFLLATYKMISLQHGVESLPP